MLAALSLLGVLLAADASSLDFTARTELRETSPAPGTELSFNARVLQLDLGALAKYDLRNWRFTAAYTPHILTFFPDQANVAGVTAMNAASFTAEYFLAPKQEFILSQSGSYGTQDNSPLNASPPGATPAQLLLTEDPRAPLVEILASFSTLTSLAYMQQISSGLSTSEHVSYGINGGSDKIAREFLPFQHTSSGDASLAMQPNPFNSIALRLSASGTNFTTGSRERIANGSLSWSNKLSTASSLSLTAGGGIGHSFGNQTSSWAPTVVSNLSITSLLIKGPQALNGSITLGVSSVIDPLGDGIYELGDAHGSLTFQATRDLRFTANGGGGRALSGAVQDGEALLNYEMLAGYRISAVMDAQAGFRGAWQKLPPSTIGGVQGSQWAAYLGLSFSDHEHL